MEPWIEAEFKYAKKLKECSPEKRKSLYAEAYGNVCELHNLFRTEKDPEKRTAGTSPMLIKRLSKLCKSTDNILEVGSGRGYTCVKLAPYVQAIFGVEVSEPSFIEANELIKKNALHNVQLYHSSAQDLTALFKQSTFDKVISIDVLEHLHPDDALDHIEQVYTILKPGGCYIIVTPNKLTGPHDITRKFYPKSTVPLGFHLNEVTYTDLKTQLTLIGFKRFRSFLAVSRLPVLFNNFRYPTSISIYFERLYKEANQPMVKKILSRFITVKIIAIK